MNNTEKDFYRQKYLKYKAKFLEAKENIKGGDDKCKPFGKPRCNFTPGCNWYDDNNKCEQKRCNEFKDLSECNKNSYCSFNTPTKFAGFCEPKECVNFLKKEECNQTTYCTFKSYPTRDGKSIVEKCVSKT